jgi:hypothetical protein
VKNTVEDKFIDDYSNSAKCDDENEQMHTDENVNIKTIPIFRKHRNNLKNIGDNKSSSHKFAIDLKEYSNVPILPAVKYVGNSMVNSINKINNMKYLFDHDQVNLNKLKFTFNAITDELNEEDDNNNVNYFFDMNYDTNDYENHSNYIGVIDDYNEMNHYIKMQELYVQRI